MGIPFYFASVMRKHKHVLRSVLAAESCDHLAIDSNSIVYDVVRSLPYDPQDAAFEDSVILAVCKKLESYLELVRPKKVFIAFDGPPPMAKMKQQRERRYKGAVRANLKEWDTVQITPGTTFMLKLDAGLEKHFSDHHHKYDFFKLSTSSEPGEGEHKLFSWIRTFSGGKTMVYGLDSDLIILAIHHLKYSPIYMLREFKDELKVLDVPKLAGQIETILGQGKLYDYIFLMFFLGNDFLPHFPALNLRTRGLDTLLETYRSVMGKDDRLYDGQTIYWKKVHFFLNAVAAKEAKEFSREYVERGKMKVDDAPDNVPLLRRELEHYVNPLEQGWEHRYYTALLQTDPTPSAVQAICSDYFVSLAWNVQYYSNECPSWDVSYKHMYPPLLKDLARHVPTETPRFAPSAPQKTPDFLRYVLPRSAAKYVPACVSLCDMAAPENYWAFCTFLWESHLLF